MSTTVNVQEAKTRLSELLRLVERGEEVSIARAGTVIARLQAATPLRRDFSKPLLPGLAPISADPLFEAMSEDELLEWEQGHSGDPLFEDEHRDA